MENRKLVSLAPAYSLDVRKTDAELEYGEDWDKMSSFVSAVIGNGNNWAKRAQKGEWSMNDWLVEGLIHRTGVSLLVGDSNVGKTLLLLDLAYSVATGQRWLRKYNCMKGPVVFLAGESSLKMLDGRTIGINKGRGRSPQWFIQNGSNLLNIIAQRDNNHVHESFPLSSKTWRNKVETMLAGSLAGAKPVLWVFDPVIALVEKPDAEESREVMNWCFKLADMTNGHVVLSHHLNKDKPGQTSQSGRIRGDSSWRGLADNVFFCTKGTSNTKITHVFLNKARDGDSPGEERPLFHVLRQFDKLSRLEFYETLKGYGVGSTELCDPQSLFSIDLRHIPYTENAEEEYSPTVNESDAPAATMFQETLKQINLEEEELEEEEAEAKAAQEEKLAQQTEADEAEAAEEDESEIPVNPLEILQSRKVAKDGRFCLSTPKGRKKVPEDGMDEVGALAIEILKSHEESLSAYQIWAEMKKRARGVGHSRLQNRIARLLESGYLLEEEVNGKPRYLLKGNA